MSNIYALISEGEGDFEDMFTYNINLCKLSDTFGSRDMIYVYFIEIQWAILCV
jgi:hypothetical protein